MKRQGSSDMGVPSEDTAWQGAEKISDSPDKTFPQDILHSEKTRIHFTKQWKLHSASFPLYTGMYKKGMVPEYFGMHVITYKVSWPPVCQKQSNKHCARLIV